MFTEVHELRVPAGQQAEFAATVYIPSAGALSSGPDILFLYPDASQGTAFFTDGGENSEAHFHAGRGNVVVISDPADASTLSASADFIVAALVDGKLIKDLGPISFGGGIALGHGTGAALLAEAQASNNTFKGIALVDAGAPAQAADVKSQVLLIASDAEPNADLAADAKAFANAVEVDTFTISDDASETLWKRTDRFIMHTSTYDRRFSAGGAAQRAVGSVRAEDDE